MTRFSYLICNFNHARSLPRALKAIGTEAGPDDEIIAVDDGSTDESPSIFAEFASRHPRARFVSLPENRGLLAASAEALLHARGRYVGLFAADDHLLPGFGIRMGWLAGRYPDAGILAQEVTIRAPSQEVRRYTFGALRESGYLSPRALSRIMRYRYFWLPTAAAFLRRDLLTEAGGWRMELDWLADWYAAYDAAWLSGVAWTSHPGAEVTENPASFGRAGLNDPIRRTSVLNAFFDLLHGAPQSGLRDRLLGAPIALLAALGDDLPNLLAMRAKDRDFHLAVTHCMRERVRLGRIGRLMALFL